MNHLEEQELLDAFYEDLEPRLVEHLHACPECRSRFESVRDLLGAVREYPVPPRPSGYGTDVWLRLAPRLPLARRRVWLRWWTLAPAFAALLTLAFFAGLRVQQQTDRATPAKARERVLLLALAEHLERSQIVITELLHTTPGEGVAVEQRGRARELVEENRLLRQTAVQSGDLSHAVLLEDLERVLLGVANDSTSSPEMLKALQYRMEDHGLLWKLRITSADVRQKGQKL